MKPVVASALLAALVAVPAAAFALPQPGQPAPPFTLTTVNGKPFSLASLKGRAVYLNFYATWCPPCNAEAPSIGKLSAKYRARGLTVLGIDELEDPQKAKSFLTQYHLPYDAVVDGDGKVGQVYGGGVGLPVHVFIDRRGAIKLVRLGEMSPAEIDAAIRSIL
jgi:cytochrome c biogenesis protein CcmG/thiol:disulfide interchange protein DsbE